MGRIIGIDLGTTNSVGAYWRGRRATPIYSETGSPFIPSVVMVERDTTIVGQDARDQIGRSRNIVYSIKRFIGRSYDDKEVQHALESLDLGYQVRRAANGEVEVHLDGRNYSPVEISAMILEKIRAEAEMTLGEDVTHAVITVPAYFGQRQKDATRRAGYLAELEVSRVINEPTAAALAFGVDTKSADPRLILVYDLGGGTFDVSILMVSGGDFDVLQTDGDNLLGGDDFDQRIVAEMRTTMQDVGRNDLASDPVVCFQLKREAEKAKIKLSRETEVRILRPALAQTRAGNPVNLDYTMTRSHLEDLVEDLVERSIGITHRAIEEAGFEANDFDHVLLVGGMTRMPFIRRRLKSLFGDKVHVDVDPMQCVGLGAAVQTTAPIEWLCPKCQASNEGRDSTCYACGRERQLAGAEDFAHIPCSECGKPNKQGRRTCWSCSAPIGAVFGTGQSARIQDIAPKHLGIETEDGTGFGVVIRKGALYPTDEPHKREFYTTSLDQQVYRLPVYELATKSDHREDWERIGEVVNDKLPPGLPPGTPIVVEMSLDGDGVLTVQSYVKKDRDKTHCQESFKFVAHLQPNHDQPAESLESLAAFGFAVEMVAQDPSINKYIPDEYTKRRALDLASQARQVVDRKDEREASELLDRILKFIGDLPVPTWDVFLAEWASNQPQVSAVERSQVERTISEMEQAAGRQDLSGANTHLDRLRQQTAEMFEQFPSELLRQTR